MLFLGAPVECRMWWMIVICHIRKHFSHSQFRYALDPYALLGLLGFLIFLFYVIYSFLNITSARAFSTNLWHELLVLEELFQLRHNLMK